MPSIAYQDFTIGTFNFSWFVREKEKRELLLKDFYSYNIDVCGLQETEIKEGLDINISLT